MLRGVETLEGGFRPFRHSLSAQSGGFPGVSETVCRFEPKQGTAGCRRFQVPVRPDLRTCSE